MVCGKCQKSQGATQLATPGVKRKNEMYHGSPSSGSAGRAGSSSGKSQSNNATLSASAGVSKSKLLSKSAQNPYAAYARNCRSCAKRTEANKVLCQRCAYKENACAICGKSQAPAPKGKDPVIQGQKFSAK